jgi:hypothetical protein
MPDGPGDRHGPDRALASFRGRAQPSAERPAPRHGKVLPTNLTVDPPREGAAAIKIQGVGICLIGGQSTDAYLQWWCENDAMVARLPKLDTPRAGMAAAVNGKTLYVVGGYNESPEVASSGTNRVQRFTVTSPG